MFDKRQRCFSFSDSTNGGQEMYWEGGIWNGWFWPVAKLKNVNSRKSGEITLDPNWTTTHMGLPEEGGSCNDYVSNCIFCIKLYFLYKIVFFVSNCNE